MEGPDGRWSMVFQLPGTGGGWLVSACKRPGSLYERTRIPPSAIPALRSSFDRLGSGGTRTRHDSPFTIDTVVAAGWPSPLRRRSLVSSTDSICLPCGCLITGRRVDHGSRAGRECGSKREARGLTLPRQGMEGSTGKKNHGRTRAHRITEKERREGGAEYPLETDAPSAATPYTPLRRSVGSSVRVGSSGTVATKTLTE